MVALLNRPKMRLAADGIDRRIFPRKEASGEIETHRMDHSVHARQHPRLSLTLRDISIGGISAISHAPLEQGERLNVFFPAEGLKRGWDAVGRVLRCQPSAMGYRIAVAFDAIPAAA